MKTLFKKITALLLSAVICFTAIPNIANRVSAASKAEVRAKIISIMYNGRAGGQMTCDFDGYVNTNGRHNGIDFAIASGANVHSLTDGEITRVSNGGGASNALSTIAIYDSVNKKTVVYLHTVPVTSLSVGQKITQGQKIATESSRGAGSAVHTHVEVRSGKQTAAAISVGAKTLTNSDPYPYWNTVLFSVPDPTLTKDTRYKTPFQAYVLGTSNVTVYSKNLSTADGTIYPTDLCTIDAVYKEGWLKVTYPISGGTKTRYVKTDKFVKSPPTGTTAFTKFTAKSNITAYTRSDLSKSFGSISNGDVCYIVCKSGNNTQVIYPISGGYKLGWVPTAKLTYTVKFNKNSGSGTMANQVINYGTATALTANAFTRTGYTFQGWALSESGAVKYANKAKVTDIGNTTLYAKWTANTYTIKYNLNGGTLPSGAPTSYTYGKSAALPTPTRSGYTFGGWYDNSGFTGSKITSTGTTRTGNLTLYAKWTVIPVTTTAPTTTTPAPTTTTPTSTTASVNTTTPHNNPTGYSYSTEHNDSSTMTSPASATTPSGTVTPPRTTDSSTATSFVSATTPSGTVTLPSTTDLTTTTDLSDETDSPDEPEEPEDPQPDFVILGRVLNNEEAPSIFDALEILKYLVGMDCVIKDGNDSFAAACVTGNDTPTIFDALEILKYLVGMPSGVNEVSNVVIQVK